MGEGYCVVNAVLIAVVLNIVLPMVLTPYATAEEINPAGGPASLACKGQFMHMMVHHGHVPLSSSLIIALIVTVSVFLGYKLKPVEKLMSLV